jgi:hypothetical protein
MYGQGCIVATFGDYAAIRQLMADLASEGIEAAVPETVSLGVISCKDLGNTELASHERALLLSSLVVFSIYDFARAIVSCRPVARSPRRRGDLRRVRCPNSLLFRIVDCDGVIQARDLEDAPVVVAQTIGKKSLLLAVDTDEQRNQKSYAARVHILKALEVQDDRPYVPIRCLVVGVHKHVLGEGGEFPLHIYYACFLTCAPDVHLDLSFGHFVPPSPVYLLYSLILAA